MKDQNRQGKAMIWIKATTEEKMLEHIKVSLTSNMGQIYDTFVEKKQ